MNFVQNKFVHMQFYRRTLWQKLPFESRVVYTCAMCCSLKSTESGVSTTLLPTVCIIRVCIVFF